VVHLVAFAGCFLENQGLSGHEEPGKMPSTRASLIVAAQTGSERAWREFVETYEPMVYRWLRREGLQHDDAVDLTQDVMAVLVGQLGKFESRGRTGGFRRWLREITIHRLLAFRRSQGRRARARGGSSFLERLHEVAADENDLEHSWNREFNRSILRQLLARLEQEVDASTMAAFRQLAIDQRRPADVAAGLGLSVGAVYSAKSRVLRRLRQEAAALVGDECFCVTDW
jgi:RNA polymerase sigma-70 factor (ECF subfamily)